MRLIAATHRDLEAAVEGGTFREDLYYRLRRGVLDVPPLRARQDDIPLLVRHIMAGLQEDTGISVRGVTAEALEKLQAHAWRGNVRELEAVLEQAAIFSGGDSIVPEDLDLRSGQAPEAASRRFPLESSRGAAVSDPLSWLQHEALRIAGERGEVRRGDLIARYRVPALVARREFRALVRLGLLHRTGTGRGARYVPLRG